MYNIKTLTSKKKSKSVDKLLCDIYRLEWGDMRNVCY